MPVLHPAHTNKVTCSKCGWSRIVDHTRTYRGGHTNAEDGIVECHEMLVYEKIDVKPPHESWYELENEAVADFDPEWEQVEVPVQFGEEGETELKWVGVAL